jgi:CheY-like chemotaxis protein
MTATAPATGCASRKSARESRRQTGSPAVLVYAALRPPISRYQRSAGLAHLLRPDVTLLDIDLGGESGLELAKRLSCEPCQARPAVILISTHGEQDYAELIAASPAIGFLPKAALSAAAIERLLARCGGHNQAH